jgi:predicted O-methyltransferase YrrM
MTVLGHFLLWCAGLAPAETQTTVAERDALASYAAGKRCLAEIGVWHGVTTQRLRTSMAADGIIHAIDPYPPGRLGFSVQRVIAHRELRKVHNGRLRWLEATGAHAAAVLATEVGGRFDFVFIDGDHSYEGLERDWAGWAHLLCANGIAALHDSRSTPSRPIEDAGSVRFTQEVIRRDPRFDVVAEVDSLTVLRRNEAMLG